MKKITKEGAKERLSSLDGWSMDGDDAIKWQHSFADFDEAMDAINQIADIARDLDHHPELSNVYNKVRLVLTTHDAGGLTEKDFNFATKVNELSF